MIARLRLSGLWALIAATGAAVAGLAVVAFGVGYNSTGDPFAHFDPAWLLLVVAGQGVALAGYVGAYRATVQVSRGPVFQWRTAVRLVTAGFAALAPRGGFAVDRDALETFSRDADPKRASAIRVLGLGALEYAVLAPAAWLCAVAALWHEDQISVAFSLPWVIGVPVGFAFAIWAAHPKRRSRLESGTGWRRHVAAGLAGVDVLRTLATGRWALRTSFAWMALYWVAEIASFYGGLRAVGGHLAFLALVLGYASGYAATRRTLPLAGAFMTEALLAYFVWLLHVGLGTAIAGVAVYRGANLVIPTLAALVTWPSVAALVEACQGHRHSRSHALRTHLRHRHRD
jgi:uncharacterized membrane protein YbhN (UPF0104 family)